MGELLKEAVENRRNELIAKLLDSDQYKKDGKHLYELTITELEYIYFKNVCGNHPHAGVGSIVWKNFSKK